MIEHHQRLGSTNDEALRRAREGARGPLFIIADEQFAGRGRHGKVWQAPPGNLNISLLLTNPAPVAQLPELGFVAGVAVHGALCETLRDAQVTAALKIKWPNDIVHHGAKLSGLMLEAHQVQHGVQACIIGIGINCRAIPDGLPYGATHLAALAGRAVEAAEVAPHLIAALGREIALHGGGAGFAGIRQRWLARAAGLGTMVSVDTGSARRSGIFQTIDMHGRLVLVMDGVEARFDAGDVFLNPSANTATSRKELESQ
ncbi:MAG: biotin--[acetyl-CoA-carboxylase] ligase [Hyphomicrobiales bacterium]|nr:biotin--[acetyl-CoA-carboxylase] ligase [Hyphomicrobiales bacterium]